MDHSVLVISQLDAGAESLLAVAADEKSFYLWFSSQEMQVWLVVPWWTETTGDTRVPLLRRATGAGDALTLCRWEKSMTTGADSSAGDGLMATDRILEFRTVLFLQGPAQVRGQAAARPGKPRPSRMSSLYLSHTHQS